MSIVNINLRVYNNTYSWMEAIGMTPVDAQITDLASFMDEMLTKQYIKISATTKKGGPALVFVVSNDNPFSKNKDVERVYQQIPMDGKTDVTIIAKSIWVSTTLYPFIKSVDNYKLYNDPRKHYNAAICTVEQNLENVKWDNFVINGNVTDGGMMLATDVMAFWVDAKKGDYVISTMSSEGIVVESQYRLVV